ncbi:hypothetical protein PAPYR_4447 [Paratrimastix pyriformis]|uniref:Single-stranded DNA binding protein Ssb-like OB fold domain-containing protein n=1 Tax=Paratrimastix pyriformis TaxID=342808 RepID=A0ABQ8USH2_9EUKA|nr:hypothetical protein PAPYR_4447 [Paratrimastix pyriformis]
MTDSTPVSGLVKLANLRPNLSGFTVEFIILEKWTVSKTKDDHRISYALVADDTASIHLSLWDNQAEQLFPGDIIRLRQGYASLYRNYLVLYPGKGLMSVTT